MTHPRRMPALVLALIVISSAHAQARQPVALRADAIDRPLRYHPDAGDFVIDNGTMDFNRPLYTAHTAARVDAGDRPEFAFFFPSRGGVLRLGIATPKGAIWLTSAKHIVARYRPGSLIYEIDDPLLGSAKLLITALPTQKIAGLIVKAQLDGDEPVDLVWAFGGGTGANSRNHFDLVESIDPAQTAGLQPEECAGAKAMIDYSSFTYINRVGVMIGQSDDSELAIHDADKWNSLPDLLASKPGDRVVISGRSPLKRGHLSFLGLLWLGKSTEAPAMRPAMNLAEMFDESENYRRSVAGQVVVDTPDPFINAMPGAMCIAADDIWQPPTFMHGANAWRTPLLGWRGPYALDALGWHDRALEHLSHWASLQNTDENIPTAAHTDPAKNLAENDWVMLHSNGNIPQSHYDMNLPFIDELYRHLFWTGDLDFARKMWPVIVRHLAWEKRCFDRDGLYEGYACIWASDGLEYNGGGATHSSAYNYFHNLMAAKVAKLIGQDPAPYEKEAARIHDAMQKNLWLADRGWYAEYKDLLGLQRVHPDAALWSIYHAIDSEVPDSFQAYQMLRYVDTHFAHIPVRGPGVPSGDWFTLPTSDWQPYEWSLNNVCMAENAHTALAYWQSGQNEKAYKLWMGTILDAMYMGICPGDLPNLSFYDPNRGESYRDFGDATGITSRAFVEGLFGIVPDALAGELTIRPGFPRQWDHASIAMPDIQYEFTRKGEMDHFVITPSFSRPMSLRLIVPAMATHADVQINGQSVKWTNVEDAVGSPRIEIHADATAKFDVSISWSGPVPADAGDEKTVTSDEILSDTSAFFDPQQVFKRVDNGSQVIGLPGHRTAFTHIQQGDLSWWQPANFQIASETKNGETSQIPAYAKWDMIDLSGVFNDKVTQIFKNDYLSPRTPFCSLQIPKQGIGNWTSYRQTAEINDTGLRQAAGAAGILKLPQGIQFRTPGEMDAKNIAFTSRWDNYPHEITVNLTGSARHVYLLMAGSTNPMETRMKNGEVIVMYADGSNTRLALVNPDNWWPIEQDYFSDDYAFRLTAPPPLRVCLGTGQAYVPKGFSHPTGGAATVLDMPLDSAKGLRSLTVRTLSNQVVIGVMSVTLTR